MSDSQKGVLMTGRISGLTVQLEHGPSASRIHTVPPKDNGGTGETFSPTDLVGAALLSCAITTMALQAAREGLAWGDASATIEKIMTGPPRRIGTFKLSIQMPKEVKVEQRARLEEIARGCPVARSLNAELVQALEFTY
jgi:uncharacterized OsmC-like protein